MRVLALDYGSTRCGAAVCDPTETVVTPIAEKRTPGAWYRQWRLVSLDGSTLDVADTAENDRAFGRPGASRGSSAYPKIRFVGLLENGTHVLWAAQVDP